MMKGTQVYLAVGGMRFSFAIYHYDKFFQPERIDASLAPEGYGIRSDMWALGLSTVGQD